MVSESLSYVHGTATQPLLGVSVGQQLRDRAQERPEALAVADSCSGLRLSWRELDEHVSRVSAGLLALGLEPGDRLGVWLMNRVEWLLVMLGAARVGMIPVSINPSARLSELIRCLNLAEARGLVAQDRFASSDYTAMLLELAPALAEGGNGALRCEAVASLRHVVQTGAHRAAGAQDFWRLADPCEPAALETVESLAVQVDFDAPANIQFSNATGGESAATTLTHHNIVNNGASVAATIALGPDDRVCLPVPLFHSFGLVMGNMACLASGAAMVYPGETFDPQATLEAVVRDRCTALYGVPAMFKAMLEHERFVEFDMRSLRTGIMAGAPCPPETMDQVIRHMHMAEVTIGYGMTESSPISFMSDIDDPVGHRLSTVGTVRPNVEVKVINAEGQIVPRGESGELCVRGYNVMAGYWGDPALTERVIDARGWLHTGDLACLDEAGYCRIVGGVKDMIIRGGENIYPAEIEGFLREHADIRDAVVVGVPDERLGEVVCACIEAQAGSSLDSEAVRAWCQDRIAHYKIPRHIRIYDRFPGSTGRALREMLRAESLAELGLEPVASGDS